MGHNTVLRGGLGIFTNMIPTVYPDQSLVDFPVASLNFCPAQPILYRRCRFLFPC